jgi:hypothetical protein
VAIVWFHRLLLGAKAIAVALAMTRTNWIGMVVDPDHIAIKGNSIARCNESTSMLSLKIEDGHPPWLAPIPEVPMIPRRDVERPLPLGRCLRSATKMYIWSDLHFTTLTDDDAPSFQGSQRHRDPHSARTREPAPRGAAQAG